MAGIRVGDVDVQDDPRNVLGNVNLSVDGPCQSPTVEQGGSRDQTDLVVGYRPFPLSTVRSVLTREEYEKGELETAIELARKEMEDELRAAEKDKNRIQQQLEAKQMELQRIERKREEDMAENIKKLAEKDLLLKEKDEENDILRVANKELQAEVISLAARNKALEDTIRQLEKEIQVLNQSVVTVQHDNQAIKEEVGECIHKKEVLDIIQLEVKRRIEEALSAGKHQLVVKSDCSPSTSPSRSPILLPTPPQSPATDNNTITK